MKLKFDIFSKCFLLMLFSVAFSNFAMSQRTVTGTVTDADTNEPLIGASVLVANTSTGTVTDFDGTYSLTVPEGATTLEFSYTGFATQKVTLGATNVINVSMSSGEVLEEVVVVGYGTKKAKEITSAVTSVKAEDFNKGNVNDATQLLQGKVSGLTITRPGGDPNGGFTVRLRGLSTVGANAEPLVIVDGVPGASLQSVDPSDIASIDVLKDGSAAAIYGTRGSSGVIIITTKKGTVGTSTVEYNGYVTAENVANQVSLATPEEFVSFGGTDLGAQTDWYGELIRTGITHVHNLSLGGGNKGTTYRFSANYRGVDGVQVGTGFDQLNARINLTQKALDDRLTFSVNLAANTRNADFGFPEAFRYASIYNPTAPIRDESATRFGGYYQQDAFDYYNPVALVEQNVNEGKLKRIVANIRADYELVDGLKVGAFYSQQRESDFFGEFYDKTSRYRGSDRNGLARRRTDERFSQLFEATANYSTEIGGNELKFLAGYSFQEFVNEGQGAEGGNFLTNAFGFNNLGAALDFSNGIGNVYSYKDASKLIAFFGRADFNIDDTYYLSATVRREGSTRFGDNNKWAVFPAASVGVNLTNLFEVSGLDNLKLRAGYGVTGALPSESYLSIQRFGPVQNFFFNGSFVPAYGPISNENPDLKWETKSEINVGLDFSFLDYKLNGALEFYNRTTKDGILLINVPVPPNLFGQTWTNVGEINNKGVELSLNYQAIQNESLTWETGVVFSTFDTELVKFTNDRAVDFRANLGAPGQNDTRLIKVEEGAPVGQIIAPIFLGLNDDGTRNIQDQDGNGVIDQNDFVVVGNGLPDFSLGFNNSFTFGDFDFNFFLRGDFGHSLVNTYRAFYETKAIVTGYNLVKTENFNPDLTDQPRYTSVDVEKASFMKLDNATIGYNVALPEGSAFNSARVYVSAQNLFVITGYTGVDPEVRFGDFGSVDNGNRPPDNPDILSPGIDRRNTYFNTRSFTFGVNLGF